jgi:deoxyhypusine synthase
MNLVAHNHYERVPNYRDLTPQQEWDLLERGLNRVTDTCIPEEEAFRRLQKHIHALWKDANDKGERYFPHEFMYKMLLSGVLEQYYQIDPKNSWMLAAAERICAKEDVMAQEILAGTPIGTVMGANYEHMLK